LRLEANLLNISLFIFVSYLFGSVQFGYLISKYIYKIDITKKGSGNTGGTNVIRVVGMLPGITSFVFDFLKGFLSALLAREFFMEDALMIAIFAGLAAIIGHNWPVFFRFRGGKGVASSVGVLFACFPMLGIATLFVFFGVVLVSRYVSIASMSAAAAATILAFAFRMDLEAMIYCSIATLLIILRHFSNIKRLVKGTENKISLGRNRTSR
jgi:glycerol-3-phosphate acyltransferase PlsY